MQYPWICLKLRQRGRGPLRDVPAIRQRETSGKLDKVSGSARIEPGGHASFMAGWRATDLLLWVFSRVGTARALPRRLSRERDRS